MDTSQGCLCCDAMYEGSLTNGLPQGIGVLKSRALLYRYEGQFEGGRRHGQGTSYFLDGAVQVSARYKLGQLVHGGEVVKLTLQSPKSSLSSVLAAVNSDKWATTTFVTAAKRILENVSGVTSLECLTGPSPMILFGDMINCRLIDEVADVCYEGQLVNGHRQGAGVCKDLKTGEILLKSDRWSDRHLLYSERSQGIFWTTLAVGDGNYSGCCKHGLMEGYGRYSGIDGYYEGNWWANKPHGHGLMKWPNGDIYVGMFYIGVRDGCGAYKSGRGAKAVKVWGLWSRDVLVKKTKTDGILKPSKASIRFPIFRKSITFKDTEANLRRCLFDHPFKNAELMSSVAEIINTVSVEVRAHEEHCRHLALRRSQQSIVKLVPSPLNRGYCTEFKLLSIEGLKPIPDRELQMMLNVGGADPIRTAKKKGSSTRTLVWDEQIILPGIFELNERVFIQLVSVGSDDEEESILGGGFIKLSLGQMSCMLIGRDSETGFRGPVALVRFQGRNVIDLKKVPREICFTL